MSMAALPILLKALGVKVSEEHIKQLEVIIPQVPQKLVEFINVVNVEIERHRQFQVRMDVTLETLRTYLHEIRHRFDVSEERDGRIERELQQLRNELASFAAIATDTGRDTGHRNGTTKRARAS